MSSSIISGMMDYLMENIEFDSLKRHISFYFIPIVNVDGVKYGSNVANLTGSVLMDYWRNPHQVYQPEVYYVKEFLAKILQETPLSLILSFTSNYDKYFSAYIVSVPLLKGRGMMGRRLRIVGCFRLSSPKGIGSSILRKVSFIRRSRITQCVQS